MTDLSPTIIAKSNQLNADDLIGNSITIKISNVSAGNSEQPIAVSYDGDNGKPWYPCKSMRRVLVDAWGADGMAYVGRSLILYRDASVQFGGIAVGGIRISHMSHISGERTVVLSASKKTKKPFTVKPLVVQKSVDKTPQQDEITEVETIIERLNAAISLEALQSTWAHYRTDIAAHLKADQEAHGLIVKAKDDKKAELTAPPQDF